MLCTTNKYTKIFLVYWLIAYVTIFLSGIKWHQTFNVFYCFSPFGLLGQTFFQIFHLMDSDTFLSLWIQSYTLLQPGSILLGQRVFAYHGNLISKSRKSCITRFSNGKSCFTLWCLVPRNTDNLGSITCCPANFGAITCHAKTICYPQYSFFFSKQIIFLLLTILWAKWWFW